MNNIFSERRDGHPTSAIGVDMCELRSHPSAMDSFVSNQQYLPRTSVIGPHMSQLQSPSSTSGVGSYMRNQHRPPSTSAIYICDLRSPPPASGHYMSELHRPLMTTPRGPYMNELLYATPAVECVVKKGNTPSTDKNNAAEENFLEPVKNHNFKKICSQSKSS